jgi:uncharacterized repeat protein (TIGR01451 family)
VTVTVTGLNDAPLISNVTKMGDQNEVITFTLNDFASQFDDVDGDNLTQVQITALPWYGVLYLDDAPVSAGQEIAAGELGGLTYQPNADYSGADAFGWNGSDGTAYASIERLVNLLIGDASSDISVSKTAEPDSVPEPGGNVTFTVRVENESAMDSVTINSLSDDVYGDLNGQGACAVPQTITAGEAYTCAFSATVAGNAGDSETSTVTAAGTDADGFPVSGQGSATVTITDVPPTISVTKEASPTVARSGDTVTFTIHVHNTSVETVTLISLIDSAFGDLTDECAFSGDLGVDDVLGCAINRTISADHHNVITATVVDDEGNEANASAEASVDVTGPAIRVIKEASVETAAVSDTIRYTYTVENVGDVTLSDIVAFDDALGAVALGRDRLEPGEVTTGAATHVVADSDWPAVVNTVIVTGTPPAGHDVRDTATVEVRIVNPEAPVYQIYLPLVAREEPPSPSPDPAPDLVVERVTVTDDHVQVVIKNIGDAPVSANNVFWVDLYVDPDPAPTGVNQTWNDGRSAEGIVWGVSAPILPLAPGASIVLDLGDAYYWPEHSNFSGNLPAGTPIYVQVDSANMETSYGAVEESHEINDEPYNNIFGPVYPTVGMSSERKATPQAQANEERPRRDNMPLRP